MHMIKNVANLSILLCVALFIQSCATAHILSSLNLNKDEESLMASSYVTADVLSQYIDIKLGKDRIIQAESFYLSDHKDIEVPIGRVISDQIAGRLVQLGYDVTRRPEAKIEIIEPIASDIEKDNRGFWGRILDIEEKETSAVEIPHITPVVKGIVLSGVLTLTRNDVLVTVRVMNSNSNSNSNSNKIIAVHEYKISKNVEIRDLLKVPGEKEPGLFDVFY